MLRSKNCAIISKGQRQKQVPTNYKLIKDIACHQTTLGDAANSRFLKHTPNFVLIRLY